MTQDTSNKSAGSSSGKPSKRTMIESSKSVEQILEAGRRAGHLMRDEIFNEAYRNLLMRYQDEIIESQPHETNKREYLYYKTQVLSDMAHELGGMVAQASSAAVRIEMEEIEDLEREH